ncbi:MinD/ParA family ATP-binding protein [Rhodococcus sp. JS3073]|uniref:MinD/ParA family ATP-binding protein n=1 Tax=Rhodococcus sp. JS3073 TaxID=3002901 RepID=UPI002285DD79|nr:ParA family protein [Rhodococcus sp. JS3073]WAM19994.1 ParA family protein [Rhodococcus sp. JS3073]
MAAPQMTVAIDDGGRHATAYVPSQAATLDLQGDTEQDLMTAVFAQAHAEARSSGQTITVAVSGGTDTAPMRLEVDPDQTIRPAQEQAPAQEPATRERPQRCPVGGTPVVRIQAEGNEPPVSVRLPATDPPPARAAVSADREDGYDRTPPARPRRPVSGLAAPEIAPGEGEPARLGVRGRLNAMLGLSLAPKAQSPEMRLRAAESVITRALPDFSVITVANPKGGVGKTPLAAALTQTFADLRGGSTVVCADLGEVGGSLAKRVAVRPSPGNDIPALLAAHPDPDVAIRPSVLSQHLTRQPSGEDIIAGRRGDATNVLDENHAAHLAAIVAQHRDILVADTGNNPLAGTWQWAVRTADAIVVPVPLRWDAADAAEEMITELASTATDVLARTIVVITAGPGDAPMAEQATVESLRDLGVPLVARMPFEPLFASGERLALSRLQPQTRAALTRLAEEVVKTITGP